MRSLKFHVIAFSLTASPVMAIPALATGYAADPETLGGTTESGNWPASHGVAISRSLPLSPRWGQYMIKEWP